MLVPDLIQPLVLLLLVAVLTPPLGAYIARVMSGQRTFLHPLLGPVERLVYRALRVQPDREQPWKAYGRSLLVFSLASIVGLYLLQRVQGPLPLNADGFGAVDPYLALNTAVSFVTNTNWQNYLGEQTMSQLTQMAGLAVQNFVSAGVGLAVAVALIRGLHRRRAATIGNFWVDLTRGVVFVLLPLSVLVASLLTARGVVQNFDPLRAVTTAGGATQHLPGGPVASQEAIKELGTNGGGYYNVNSAHPLENPTPLSNFFECLAILLIPAALCFTFGRMIGARKQGIALLVTMAILLVPFVVLTLHQEQQANPAFTSLPIDHAASALQAGGNMEGKETRFGISASALWATATTAASNGSVNAMHDSFTPLGGLGPMFLIALGEVSFGGVGSGLYGLVIFAIVAVFIAGLMVGRTPEFLGKKIEAYEMKMASWAILVPVAAVLIGAACACFTDETYTKALANHGPHGFSEVLYAFISQGNNNGSAFGGLTASGTFFATAGGICMWVARYWIIVPTLAIAGSLARKKLVPPSSGTLPTAGPLFVILLVGVVLLVGALSFVPALALGPIVEHLALHP
jgi:K+-transporting ATPase ATPase A chain